MAIHLIKLYQNKIYGSGYSDEEFSLIGADTKKYFEEHLKTQSLDWEYRTKRVTYIRNNLGHRCKELNELNKNFILFTGCSLTEGVGVKLEDSFTYLLSKKLGVDYYNLGLAGSGPDLLSENLSFWFQNIKLIPKLLVIQWPAPNRYYHRFEDGLTPMGVWISIRNKSVSAEVKKSTNYDFVNKKIIENFVNASHAGYFEHYFQVLRSTTLNFLNCLGINYIEFTEEDFPNDDTGRDLTHPGTMSNLNLANKLEIIVKEKGIQL